jgi:hypothetical protein
VASGEVGEAEEEGTQRSRGGHAFFLYGGSRRPTSFDPGDRPHTPSVPPLRRSPATGLIPLLLPPLWWIPGAT